MASFVPPIAGNLTDVTVAAPTRALLDDTGHRAVLLSELTAASITAVAPIRSYADPIEIDGDPFVRLSPLPAPVEAAGVFRKLGEAGATVPTFYFGAPGLTMTSGVVAAGDTIVSGQAVRLGATMGVCALAPREWARVLLDAMTRAQESDLGPWADFVAALADGPALYVLRHTGQPPAPNEMQFDLDLGDGVVHTVPIDARSDLAAAAAPRNVFAPNARVRLRTPGVGGIPYHTAYDSDLRSSAERDAAPGDRWFEPSRFPSDVGTLLCTDLNGWFGARPAGVSLPRWHTGNRVEPLLDGIETFARLWDDLLPLRAPDTGALRVAHDGTPFGIWMTGLVFQDFELVPGVPASKFVDLVKTMDGHGFHVRILAAKGFMFEGTESEEERRLLMLALFFALAGINIGSEVFGGLGFGLSDEAWTRLTLAAVLLTILASTQFVDLISDKLDFSKDVLAALAEDPEITPGIALWSRYPARFSDNPARKFPAAVIQQLLAVERTGWHHMKIEVLALPGASVEAPPTYVAYLGGIDINKNRLDSWAHRWPRNYHDIHARVTGPAAADVFQTFYERWEDELDRMPDEERPAATNGCPRHSPRPGTGHAATASLTQIPADAGDDIVQIARTLYRPAPANADEGFWYAPQGEASVHDSVLRAIHSAREYIYIEDQYMTPADSRGEGDEILEALQGAASRCKALILVFSQGTLEQLFGRERRNELFARLLNDWGPERFLPLIHSRQVLGPADRISSRGRTLLKSPIDEFADQVLVADGIRVPDTPCWAWIGGELVLVVDSDLDTLTGESTLEVVRGPDGDHQDVWAREHPAGAPVTFTNLDDVFIHAKIVLIDDVYASIGSANMNRRAMFHDGELNAIVVPGRLRAAVDNPVRSLRCRVWGDHLGLPPHVAEAELADPLAALPLFARTRAAGNPLSRHQLLDNTEPEGFEVPLTGPTAIEVLESAFGGVGSLGGDFAKAALWTTLIDPTTSLDPFFDTEPFDL
jgi:phosphatidylserine/phosphatidylglycerophosphate/cardiolipin synthase-like enzyme